MVAIQELVDELNERVETNTLIEVEQPTPEASQIESSDDEMEYYHIDILRLDTLYPEHQ